MLLIVWDTVRAGNLSLHGYGRRTTPNLERLAAGGVRFDRAFATSSWTLPSHASLFTGRWPHELSAGWKVAARRDLPHARRVPRSLGYDTAGFVANLDYCSRETGLAGASRTTRITRSSSGRSSPATSASGSRIDLLTPASVINRLLKQYWGDAV